MAVSRNPYQNWEDSRNNSDYRCTDTQVTSLVRQQLSQSEYLTSSNRVSPGPRRVKRTRIATEARQIPHVLSQEDMWGWQSWTRIPSSILQESGLATGLVETYPYYNIPGGSYDASNRIGGGAYTYDYSDFEQYSPDFSSIPFPESVEIEVEPERSKLNNIPVNSSVLSQSASNYVMVYDPSLNEYTFVSPEALLGYGDADSDSSDINFGSY